MSPAPPSGELTVSCRRPGDLDEAFRARWEELFERQAGPANPFTAPAWVEIWYRFFARPSTSVLLVAERGGDLVAVFPFHLSTVQAGPATLARRLLLVGAGQGSSLLEQPEPLILDGEARAVHRALVTGLMCDRGLRAELRRLGLDPSWVELSIAQRSGWFEPEWVTQTGCPTAFHRLQRSRASVLLALSGSWEQTRSGLKRNVKESLRRSRNRLKKDGRTWQVLRHREGIDHRVVERFLGLHQARASESASSVPHHDAFADLTRQAFLHQLLPVLGRQGRASIWELTLDGTAAASQLILHAPGTSYVHSSGFLPEEWALGPTSFLQGQAIEAAADRGEGWINFSPGPNQAKLRWSEQLDVTHDWSFGTGAVGYGLFSAVATRRELKHQIAMAARGSAADA